ncbi:MAG: SPOR domain-containing protein [Gammaproteobacteria bacterium]|nr:SPOR domain-containing protein [Gammaproteobacteria bacterium]
MNEQIKQRLIGAVVLVSLAVIFIPMLLDGGINSTMPRFGSTIPAQPEFDFEPLEIPLQAITPIPADRPRVIEQEVALAPTAGQPPQEIPAQQRPAPPPLPDTAPSAAPIRWVVQVGSFSQSVNAMALRDRLRKGGFSVFVEKFQDRGKSSYRVRVGPELKRENAEKQRERLDKHFQLKGIVMGHP